MPEVKWCRGCKQWLPRGAFDAKPSSEDGLHPFCVSCHHEWRERQYGTASYASDWREFAVPGVEAKSDNGFGILSKLAGKLPAQPVTPAEPRTKPQVAAQPLGMTSNTSLEALREITEPPVNKSNCDPQPVDRQAHSETMLETDSPAPAASSLPQQGETLELALLYGEAQRQIGRQEIIIERQEQELASRQAEIERLLSKIEDLQLELDVARLDLEAATKPAFTSEVLDAEPVTVLDALERAMETFQTWLVFCKSAQDSARESDFSRPSEVFRALVAIRDLAEKYFETKAARKRMGPWDAFLIQRGFHYAPCESQTTLTMYGAEREFLYKGEKRLMQRHITIGGGDRRNCLQIYFDIDEEANRFIIGYCGRHLSHYGMRT